MALLEECGVTQQRTFITSHDSPVRYIDGPYIQYINVLLEFEESLYSNTTKFH